MDVVDDSLCVLMLLEAYTCLACTFTVVLVASYSHHHIWIWLLTHLEMFLAAAVILLLTAAIAELRRVRRQP